MMSNNQKRNNNWSGGRNQNARPYDNTRNRQTNQGSNQQHRAIMSAPGPSRPRSVTRNSDTPADNPFRPSNQVIVGNEIQNQEDDLQNLNYLERRDLKNILKANKKFHLIGFEGVPKKIPTAEFLSDLSSAFNEIQHRKVVSIHMHTHENPELINYLVGVNNVKIIEKFKELCHDEEIALYGKKVLLKLPDLNATNNCEYNLLRSEVSSTLCLSTMAMKHQKADLIQTIKFFSDKLKEKFWLYKSFCNAKTQTFITFSEPGFFFDLTALAAQHNFKIEHFNTITLTGKLPQQLIEPAENEANSLTVDELMATTGFKSLISKAKDEEKNRPLQAINSTLKNFSKELKNHLSHWAEDIHKEIFDMKIRLNDYSPNDKLQTITDGLTTMKTLAEDSYDLLYEMNSKQIVPPVIVHEEPKKKTSTKPARVKTIKKTPKAQEESATSSTSSAPTVNPSTNGTTVDYSKMSEEDLLKIDDDELLSGV